MIAKEVEQASVESTKYFNLVEEVDAKKVDGTIVKVEKIIQKTCLEDLNREKENLTAQIAKVDEKIAAIGKIATIAVKDIVKEVLSK